MFIHAAAGCSTHIYTLIFYHKLSFTCHPYNQSEPCVNWNRASVNRHGWGAKKKTRLSLIQLGGVFLCHFCVFSEKKWYTFVIMCVKCIYIYTKYVQNTCTYKRIPIFLTPSNRHRCHCRNNYNRLPQGTIEHLLRCDILAIVLKSLLYMEKNSYSKLINTYINNNDNIKNNNLRRI